MKAYKNTDEYIKNFSPDIQKRLNAIRQTIKKVAPDAQEKISYGIPTFTFHGNLVHFAAFKDHLSFFPGASPIAEFKKETAEYKTAKGTLQLPLDQALPLPLITKMTKSAVKRNLVKKR